MTSLPELATLKVRVPAGASVPDRSHASADELDREGAGVGAVAAT